MEAIQIGMSISIQGLRPLTEDTTTDTTRLRDRMIPRADGAHYHEIEGITYLAYTTAPPIQYGGVVYVSDGYKERHRHSYKGITREIVGNEPLGW